MYMLRIKDWIIDTAHFVHNATLMYVRHTPPKHYLNYVIEGKVAVILLPGIFGRWAFLKPLGDYISLQGHPVYIVPKLGNNLHDIPASSKLVAELMEEQRLTEVIIVAHSKGGLIGKYLMLHDDPRDTVDGLVAIATPFSGSELAELVPHYSAKEMKVDSELITYLTKHTEVDKKIISILPEYDNIIWHAKGSFLEGALDNIVVKSRGHQRLLRDKAVWERIIESINRLVGSME